MVTGRKPPIKTFERKKKSPPLILCILHLQQRCLQLSINSCQWASCQCRRPPTGSRAGAAQRKSISRRQLRPVLTKQPRGRDGERPRLRIRDKVVPSLWRFYSSRPSQSASAPPPGPSWPFPHFGDQPIAARCIMGDVVPERGRGGTCL